MAQHGKDHEFVERPRELAIYSRQIEMRNEATAVTNKREVDEDDGDKRDVVVMVVTHEARLAEQSGHT